jgi:hypothetical protein
MADLPSMRGFAASLADAHRTWLTAPVKKFAWPSFGPRNSRFPVVSEPMAVGKRMRSALASISRMQ